MSARLPCFEIGSCDTMHATVADVAEGLTTAIGTALRSGGSPCSLSGSRDRVRAAERPLPLLSVCQNSKQVNGQ